MLDRLARFSVVRRRAVMVMALIFVIAAGAIGGGVAKHLSSGGFDDPRAENSQVRRLVDQRFPNASTPNLVLVVTAKHDTVDAPDVNAAGVALTEDLARRPAVAGAAFSYWTIPGAVPLRSRDGKQALVLVHLSGNDDAVRHETAEIVPEVERGGPAIAVRAGGYAEVFREVGTTIEHDLQRAESMAVPLTMILLVLVFGTVVAAGLPLGVGALAVVGTFLVLRVLAALTQVSIFSLNLTTALGLGLAIDYSLFIVSRYREELDRGTDPRDAVMRTVRTAGRTVVFSGLTVAVSLAALLVFPLAFLRSFAYAGIAVVALAVTGAVVVLPAILATLRYRVDRLAVFRHRSMRTEPGEGFWHRVATAVMRRPVVTGGAVILLLVVLGLPFAKITFGLPDDRVLPASASSRQAQDDIRRNFSSNEAGALTIVAPGVTDAAARSADIDRYATDLSRVKGVARVDAVTGIYLGGQRVIVPTGPVVARFLPASGQHGALVSVVPSVEPNSPAGERLVKDVRHLAAPFAVKVGGPSAQLVDSKASVFNRLPLAAAIIALVTFTALFLMTGSVVVPVKALVLNLLSLSATFGAMVWIFQSGHFAGFLGFTPTGTIDTTTPILMFCVAFGLSMDFEVFLLSRIKEEHDHGSPNTQAVAMGLERTGRIVTAAAGLMAVVFISFATSGVAFIKLFGIGLTMAVLVDATLVRGVLVPAFMRLAGDANWWAPRPLRWLHDRIGFTDSDDDSDSDSGFDAALWGGERADERETVGGRR